MIDARLQELVRTVFSARDVVLHDETTPSDIPNWDSLRLVNLIFAIEERFQIELDAEELIQIESFGELQRLISERVEAR